jgi:hypothetical protein
MRHTLTLLVALLAALSCDDGGGPTPVPTPDAGPDAQPNQGEQPAPDAGAPDCSPVEPVPEPPAPDLPPCERACDRATDCATDGCEGFAWTNAGGVAATCYAACDAGFADALLSAPGCPEVEQALGVAFAEYDALCASNPCDSACERLGSCVEAECPGFVAPAGQQIATDCASNCNPEDAAWVEQVESCGALVDAIAGGDPGFAQACQGDERVCPDAGLCDAYAEKVTGCFVAHCEPAAADFDEGLRGVFTAYCQSDPECPEVSTVESILSDEIDCDHPWLREVGPAPPFSDLCDGTSPDFHSLVPGCEALMACPGAEGLGGVSQCAVFIALRPDGPRVAPCLVEAAGDCPAVFACLEER